MKYPLLLLIITAGICSASNLDNLPAGATDLYFHSKAPFTPQSSQTQVRLLDPSLSLTPDSRGGFLNLTPNSQETTTIPWTLNFHPLLPAPAK